MPYPVNSNGFVTFPLLNVRNLMAYYSYTHRQMPHRNRPASASASPLHPKEAAQRLEQWHLTVRMGPSGQNGTQQDGELLVLDPLTKPKRPSLYKVVLLNDDYTPMDFVVAVLETIFHKTHEDAVDIMLTIHSKGAAICGVFTRDVAETKADQVTEYARINDHPLQCVVEKE